MISVAVDQSRQVWRSWAGISEVTGRGERSHVKVNIFVAASTTSVDSGKILPVSSFSCRLFF
ncbi:MAG: hypothetical protein BJ554DRAFT_7361 [Olpidium bornovanus]|uniref:Uncharacterized protein n=1 Tax=Olpidium bornovanus TaxID=278681 RepID=A0A8H7ZWA8_9FUNG|nr:MAG: hypothetical protein BJ554DRAFT_7361 [Olpidium bornovanus]